MKRCEYGAIRQGLLALAATAVLTACGGGGGGGGGGPIQPPPDLVSIGGTITGLAEDRTITLVLEGSPSETFAQLNITGFEFVFARELSRGADYSVLIGLNPMNQLCRIDNASGVANSDVRDIEITCHDTLINDTGVTSGQDGATGRDAAATAGNLAKVGAGRLGFDFSRVCASGQTAGSGSCPVSPTRGAGANEWACTRDNVTGLLWQVITEDADHAWADRNQAVTAANGAELCGRDDWRLPEPRELAGFVDAGVAFDQVAVDAAYFPDTAPILYWTSRVSVQDNDASWAVDFDSGAVTIQSHPAGARVRLVSGTEGNPDFESVGDVLVDHSTGLMWFATNDVGDWDAALTAADGANAAAAGGFDDWRLPNRNELGSLVDRLERNPAVDPEAAASVESAGYWSSSAFSAAPGMPAMAWGVDFDNGDVVPREAELDRRILLVRNQTHGAD